MNEKRSNDLLFIQNVYEYEKRSWRRINEYKEFYLSLFALNLPDESFNQFIDKTIEILKRKQKLINDLKSISIDTIKEDLGENIYNILIDQKVNNIYRLKLKVYCRYNGEIISKISSIGTKKGKFIIEILEKNGYMDIDLHGDTWDKINPKN